MNLLMLICLISKPEMKEILFSYRLCSFLLFSPLFEPYSFRFSTGKQKEWSKFTKRWRLFWQIWCSYPCPKNTVNVLLCREHHSVWPGLTIGSLLSFSKKEPFKCKKMAEWLHKCWSCHQVNDTYLTWEQK